MLNLTEVQRFRSFKLVGCMGPDVIARKVGNVLLSTQYIPRYILLSNTLFNKNKSVWFSQNLWGYEVDGYTELRVCFLFINAS